MSKNEKLYYKCSVCGYKSLKWLGRCSECLNWDTFEFNLEKKNKIQSILNSKSKILSLKDFVQDENIRFVTKISEFDRVSGGGIVLGSSILISGEPGIGKSTFLLQISDIIVNSGKKVVYLAGEESIFQIKLRASRLNVISDIFITHQVEIDSFIESIKNLNFDFIIIDSIQTLRSDEIQGGFSTISQIKHCVYRIIEWTKDRNITLLLTGHITKEGIVAGPKVIEHMVDAVFYFEEAEKSLRTLRVSKNRFGNVNEIGIFKMMSFGFVEVKDCLSIFFKKKENLSPGVSIGIINEGSRVLFIEIQTLISKNGINILRIFSEKIDSKKISRLLAVLTRYLSLNFKDNDIYVNVTGGIRIDDVEIDLAILIALFSAKINLVINENLVFTGEVSLSGDIRLSSNLERKVFFAKKAGFKNILGAELKENKRIDGYKGVDNILNLIKKFFKFNGK